MKPPNPSVCLQARAPVKSVLCIGTSMDFPKTYILDQVTDLGKMFWLVICIQTKPAFPSMPSQSNIL